MTGQEPQVYGALDSGIAVGVGGLVYRTDWAIHILFPDGSYRYDWPDQGLFGSLAADQEKNPSFWGRWHADGTVVEVERPQARLRFTLAEGAIVDEDGRRFERLASSSGEELPGTWRREASASDKPAIRFDRNGRFETLDGLLGLIADPSFVSDWGAAPSRSLFDWPDTNGDYAVRPFSLHLRRSDGAELDFLALTSPARMRLGYTWFRRDP